MLFRLSLFVVVFVVSSQASAGTLSWVTHERWVTVAKVLDGDTFSTTRGEKVRLLGINTPEIQHDSSPEQPFGYQAKVALQRLIDGKQVRLTFDKEKKDKYKRSLAHVYLRDGMWVNGELVRLGLAHVYTFEPNIKAAKSLVDIELKAIQMGLNMWSNDRWRVLNPKELSQKLLGQFRLIHATLIKENNNSWRLELGKLAVTVPKKYRQGFAKGLHFSKGDNVLVRGRLRKSNKGQWFLSVHTPMDIVLLQ